MQSTLARISTLAVLLTLALPVGPLEAEEASADVDVFAAALRAGGAIKKEKARAFTLERIALAWARTDFCAEALAALRAGGDGVSAEAALDVALICAETVADLTARRLLTFARGRVNMAPDPVQRAVGLAALAGAHAELDQVSARDDAARRAGAAVPATCVPLDAVLSRTTLALRFLDAGMEAWAARLLAGAARVAMDLPGDPTDIDDRWSKDEDPQGALTAAVLGHLRFYAEEAPGFDPPPPLKDCPPAKTKAAARIAEEKPVALAAVSAVLRRFGDAENAALARTMASALVWGIRDAEAQDRAAHGAGTLLAERAPPEDAIGFLSDVASVAPNPARKVFSRLVFTNGLRTRTPMGAYLEAIMSLSMSPGPPQGSVGRFNAAVARAFLDLGDPVRALDVASKIVDADDREPILAELLPSLAAVSPERAKAARDGIEGPWLALEGLCDQASAKGLEDAWRASLMIEKNAARNLMLHRIGRHHLRCGDTSRALGTTRRMTGKKRDRLLWSISLRQLDAGDSVAALETIRDIKSQGHRARAIAEVALRLGKAGATLDAAGAELLRSLTP